MTMVDRQGVGATAAGTAWLTIIGCVHSAYPGVDAAGRSQTLQGPSPTRGPQSLAEQPTTVCV